MFYGHLGSSVSLAFRYICRLPYLLYRFVSFLACEIGVITALLFGSAEYVQTQGMVKQNLEQVHLAFKLFPWDFRFRTGLIQIADLNGNAAIPILLEVQQYEPTSISLMIILTKHMRDNGDNVGAAKQLKMALDLKRKLS